MTTQTGCGVNFWQLNTPKYLDAQTAFVSNDRVLIRFKIDVSSDSNFDFPCLVNYQYDHCQVVPCDISCK